MATSGSAGEEASVTGSRAPTEAQINEVVDDFEASLRASNWPKEEVELLLEAFAALRVGQNHRLAGCALNAFRDFLDDRENEIRTEAEALKKEKADAAELKATMDRLETPPNGGDDRQDNSAEEDAGIRLFTKLFADLGAELHDRRKRLASEIDCTDYCDMLRGRLMRLNDDERQMNDSEEDEQDCCTVIDDE